MTILDSANVPMMTKPSQKIRHLTSHMPLPKACETVVVTKKLGDHLASNLHSLTGNGVLWWVKVASG